jgi:hypothetical protein
VAPLPHLTTGVVPGRDQGATAPGTTHSQQQRRRLTFMVGLWGDDDSEDEEENEDEEEQEEQEAWAPGPMARVPYHNARLAWPRRLGAAGDWGLMDGGGGRDPPAFVTECDAASGLLVLPRGAWRPIAAAASASSSRPAQAGGGGGGLFSPKATHRFVLREAGEVGAEIEVLLEAAMDDGEGSEEGSF